MIAKGDSAHNGEVAQFTIGAGSSADFYWDSSTESYAVFVSNPSEWRLDSKGSTYDIDVGVTEHGSDGYFFGRSGTIIEGTVVPYLDGYTSETTIAEPTGILKKYNGSDDTLNNPSQLETLETLSDVGDVVDIETSSEGDYVAVDYADESKQDTVLVDTTSGDTGRDTAQDTDDTGHENDDTGNDRPEGCGEGCSALSANPDLGKNAFGTRLALLIALGAGLLSRRKEKK